MYCHNCGAQSSENAKFCSECGIPTQNSNSKNFDTFETLQLKVAKLKDADLPSLQEKMSWAEGIFVGKEGSHFHVDLPSEYRYNSDIRLQGTNSFVVKDKYFHFTLAGEEISEFFQTSQDLMEFKNSINTYFDKLLSTIINAGAVVSEKDFRLHGIETENFWWARTILSYKMDSKIFWKSSGYNVLGKALVKILGGNKSLKKAGYKKGEPHKEYKIVDVFYPKSGFKHPFFALIYTFDEITGGDQTEMIRTINGISNSMGYYDKGRENEVDFN